MKKGNAGTEFSKTFRTMIFRGMEFRFVSGALESKLLLIGKIGSVSPVTEPDGFTIEGIRKHIIYFRYYLR